MIRNSSLRKRILTGFLLFGLINFFFVALFIYMDFRSVIIDRGFDHMSSVRSLAQNKVLLYLEGLKQKAFHDPQGLLAAEEVTLLCEKNQSGWRPLKGNSCSPATSGPVNVFKPDGHSEISLRTMNKGKEYFWKLSLSGFTRILNQREGLGLSGEIYLAGKDHLIKSASRFVKNWKEKKVEEDSIREALAGKTGTHQVQDYRGVEVISSFAPLFYDELFYVILSEIDTSEVTYPLKKATIRFSGIAIVILLLNLLIAGIASGKILEFIRKMQEEIRLLNRRAADVQEKEREKIAHHLHDHIGQSLTALKWGLSKLSLDLEAKSHQSRIKELESMTETMMSDVRILSHELMPTLLRDLGLFRTLRDFLRNQQKNLPIKIDYKIDEQIDQNDLPDDLQVNIYRMVQELLQNAVKHSEAKHVFIGLFTQENKILLRYTDDGKGMRDETPLPRSLIYRAQLFNGTGVRDKSINGLSLKFEFEVKAHG